MTLPELIPNGVPLSSVPGLTAAQVKTLNDSWIITAQEFVALHGTNDELRNRLAQALGVSRAALDDLAAAARQLIPPTRDIRSLEMEREAAQTEYGLGALLDEPPAVLEERLNLPPYTPTEGRAVLPTSYSLLELLPPVRNQGGRGTCVAHAVVAVREQLEIAAGSPPEMNLSEQYVYWWCKAHDGIPKVSGTYVSVGMRCLSETGAPWEEIWPYVSREMGDQGQGPPPDAAANGDPAFRTLRTQEFNRTDITGIKTCLSEGRAVAFSVPVFDSWYASSATSRWGKITLPLPGEPADGGHAMALVGYQDDPDAPGGGYFLVRNSWQPWSWDGVWQEGYGYVSYAYISRHATAVFSGYRIAGKGLYLRDHDAEVGPRTAASLTWNSPDIWLRQTADDGTQPQPPLPGQPNAIYVRTIVRGPTYAYDVRADVFYAPAATYIRPESWKPVGRLRARWLGPGETVLGPLAWTPPTSGPYALLVKLAAADDDTSASFNPATDENVAQQNLWPVSAAAGNTVAVTFDLAGVPGKPGAVSLEVDRGGLPANVVVSPVSIGPALDATANAAGGDVRGIVDNAVIGAVTGGLMLGMGQRRRASLTLSLPAQAARGTRYAAAVIQKQGAETVGRLTIVVDVT
jgi:C1A family cysteine protease